MRIIDSLPDSGRGNPSNVVPRTCFLAFIANVLHKAAKRVTFRATRQCVVANDSVRVFCFSRMVISTWKPKAYNWGCGFPKVLLSDFFLCAAMFTARPFLQFFQSPCVRKELWYGSIAFSIWEKYQWPCFGLVFFCRHFRSSAVAVPTNSISQRSNQ